MKKQKTDEEIADDVADRMRGSPKRRLRAFAEDLGWTLEQLMENLDGYVNSHGAEWIIDGARFEGTHFDLWDEYELVSGKVVPADIRWSPFSCSC